MSDYPSSLANKTGRHCSDTRKFNKGKLSYSFTFLFFKNTHKKKNFYLKEKKSIKGKAVS